MISRLATPRVARVLLVLTALCLSASHVIARSVHGEIPPIGLSFWRWVTGALILAPLVLPKALRRCEVYREHVPILAVLGFLIVGSTTALFVALNFTTAVNVSLINAIQPVLTVMLAVVFLRDHISRAGMAGIVAATLGALVMLTEGDFSNLFRFRLNGGDLIALAATVGLSLYALNLKRLPADLSMTESLFVISLTGSLMLLPLYVLESVIYMPVPMRTGTVVVVLELALLVSVFGNLMWNLGNRVIGPAHAAMFINLIPLFGAALAITFLGERIFFHHWVGALLICTGIWAIVGGINPKR